MQSSGTLEPDDLDLITVCALFVRFLMFGLT